MRQASTKLPIIIILAALASAAAANDFPGLLIGREIPVSSGEPWGPAAGTQALPSIAVSTSGATLVWSDMRSSVPQLYFARVVEGELFPATGKPVPIAHSEKVFPIAAGATRDGTLVIFQSRSNDSGEDSFWGALKIGPDGSLILPSTRIAEHLAYAAVLAGGPDRFVLLWEDQGAISALVLDGSGTVVGSGGPWQVSPPPGSVAFAAAPLGENFAVLAGDSLLCIDSSAQLLAGPARVFPGREHSLQMATSGAETWYTRTRWDADLEFGRIASCGGVQPLGSIPRTDSRSFLNVLTFMDGAFRTAWADENDVLHVATLSGEGTWFAEPMHGILAPEGATASPLPDSPIALGGDLRTLVRKDGAWIDDVIVSAPLQMPAGISSTDESFLASWVSSESQRFGRFIEPGSPTFAFPEWGNLLAAGASRHLAVGFGRGGGPYQSIALARFVGPAPALSEAIVIGPGIEGALVWSGTEFLYFGNYPGGRPSFIPSALVVQSIHPSGALGAQSLLAGYGVIGDAACGEPGCLVVWSNREYECPFYCTLSDSGLLAGKISQGGDPAGQSAYHRLHGPLPDGAETLRLHSAIAPLENGFHVFSLWGTAILLDRLNAEGVPLGTATIAASDPVDRYGYTRPAVLVAARLGDHALLVWQREKTIFARLVSASGETGPTTMIAPAGVQGGLDLAEHRGVLYLQYARIVPEAGYVPRVFLRAIGIEPVRRRATGR